MAVGIYEFPSHLTAASVDAVAYGFEHSEELNRGLPIISLVAQDADHLARAFQDFAAWAAATDPDAVEVTFVFRESGGYLLTIEPEVTHLERRCLGFDRAHRAMASSVMWVKPIDTVDPMLKRLREYSSRTLSPFLFHGATYGGSRSSLEASSLPQVRPLSGVPPLLKFEVNFVDEKDVLPHSSAWYAIELDAGRESRSKPQYRVPNASDTAQRRIGALRCHFPVTLERLARSSWFLTMRNDLTAAGIKPWQIEQALCNLVLCRDMGCGEHFTGLSARKLQRAVVEALRSRYELADGVSVPHFALEQIEIQLLADGNALLKDMRKEPQVAISDLQAALASVSALVDASAMKHRTDQAEA